ncbi:hypothetical protein ABZU32_08870 [Sphaerisporangium sp. NPDC005288]|uniref:hypothetical protein n=1 Tax=Sphaerisporangium sp. NPDC005288 TaxID=3155114 RepID=UPI0033A9BA1E
MAYLRSSIAIRDPRASEMRIHPYEEGGAFFFSVCDDVWFTLRQATADVKEVEEEAAAMDRLAELAAEAAATLRRRCVQCGTRDNLAQQFDAHEDRLVWLCAGCHASATSRDTVPATPGATS